MTLEDLYNLDLSHLFELPLVPGPVQKTWPEFNEDMVYWNGLNVFVKQGLLLKSDLPPKPDPVNYPNTPADDT